MPHIDMPTSRCQVGLARADITPTVGTYHRMWGAALHDQSTGVHRPLTATALALKAQDAHDGPGEIVFLALDHCLFWDAEMREFLSYLEKQTGLDRSQIQVVFSHTHGAGLMDRSREKLPGGDRIAPYLQKTAETSARLIQEARSARKEAILTYSTGRCSLARHRDFYDDQTRQIVCGYNPQGPADDTVLVIRIANPAGKLLGTLVNYACHPTTLAFENTLISPDFIGALQETVEMNTQAPCIFLQGASGDLGPRHGFVGDPAVADRNGRELAFAVLSTLEALDPPDSRFRYVGPVISGATLGIWKHEPAPEHGQGRWTLENQTVALPYRADLPTLEKTRVERDEWFAEEEKARSAGDAVRVRDCRAMIERKDRLITRLQVLPPGKEFPMPVLLLQLGDAIWVGVEGEHYQILQTELRKRFPQVPLVVMTLVNGSRCFYLVPKEAYGKGIYQESVAVLAPGSLEQLIETIAERMKRLISAQ